MWEAVDADRAECRLGGVPTSRDADGALCRVPTMAIITGLSKRSSNAMWDSCETKARY